MIDLLVIYDVVKFPSLSGLILSKIVIFIILSDDSIYGFSLKILELQ